MNKINWDQIIDWDKKYYMHPRFAMDEWTPVPIAKVDGCYLIDKDGNKMLDFMSGYICVTIGQRYHEIQEKIKEALDKYGYLPDLLVNPYKSEAAKLIIEDILGSDGWAGRVRFLSTGSEAVEEAAIISRLYTDRPNIFSREFNYHGWTLGAASLTSAPLWRNNLTSPKSKERRPSHQQPSPGFFIAPAPNCYHCPYGYEKPPDCETNGIVACLNSTDYLFRALGCDTIAGIVTELISGGALYTTPKEYVRALRKITREYGILWIDDEVMTGFCRTGKWFAYQHYDEKPDIITMGKGIVNSALPGAGVVVNKDIAEFFDQYRWWQATTFAAHPIVTAAITANIQAMIKMNAPERSTRLGEYLGKRLKELENSHICVGQVSGKGLFWGIEIVKDKKTKEPIVKMDKGSLGTGDLSTWPTNIIRAKAAEKGVIAGGFYPNQVRIGPSMIITEEEIDKGIEALDYGLTEIDKYCK